MSEKGYTTKQRVVRIADLLDLYEYALEQLPDADLFKMQPPITAAMLLPQGAFLERKEKQTEAIAEAVADAAVDHFLKVKMPEQLKLMQQLQELGTVMKEMAEQTKGYTSHTWENQQYKYTNVLDSSGFIVNVIREPINREESHI